jgi:hypothetical protein
LACSSLHPLKGWSLRQTRRGSQREDGQFEHECDQHADAEQAEDDAGHYGAILLVRDLAVIALSCRGAIARSALLCKQHVEPQERLCAE